MSNVASKYQIDTPENREFLRTNAEGLLRFGHRFPSPGGGSYYLGDDGTPWKERPRETWITSRMCHVYSIGTFLSHPGSEELADAALKGLRGELHDTENGGWYSGRTADDGIMPGKACYAHAFVILAASSAVLAERPGAQELLDEALALYDKRFSRSMTSASGMRRKASPVTPGIRNLRSSTVIAASMPTCTPWRRFLPRRM